MERIRHSFFVCFALVLALFLCALPAGCHRTSPAATAQVLLDGQAWTGAERTDAGSDGLRVFVTLDGAPLIDLPFGAAHTISILQPDGAENVVELTGDAVRMARANCDNQDCVHMSDITRDNLELRVMGGFIICLPHRISVEVRED